MCTGCTRVHAFGQGLVAHNLSGYVGLVVTYGAGKIRCESDTRVQGPLKTEVRDD